MHDYKPRRASKRWLDADCPKGVLAIFDNSEFADRYTVFYTEVIDSGYGKFIGYRGMSENPNHPQGVGMYGELAAHEVANFRYRNSKRAITWSILPEMVKHCVRQDCETKEMETI